MAVMLAAGGAVSGGKGRLEGVVTAQGVGLGGGPRRICVYGDRSCRICMVVEAAVAYAVEEFGWWPQRFAPRIFPDLMILLLLCVYLYLFVYFACLTSVIRVIFTHCGVLVLCFSLYFGMSLFEGILILLVGLMNQKGFLQILVFYGGDFVRKIFRPLGRYLAMCAYIVCQLLAFGGLEMIFSQIGITGGYA